MTSKKTWAINIGCSLFQLLLIIVLGIAFYVGSYIVGGLIWGMLGNAQLGLKIGPIVSAGVVFISYAVAWYLFWLSLSNNGKIPWFYTRMILSTIPLVGLLCLFHPLSADRTSMSLVNVPNDLIISTEVTGIILFPLYSLGLHKYVLQTERGRRRNKNLALLCLTMIVTGTIVYSLAWSTVGRLYAQGYRTVLVGCPSRSANQREVEDIWPTMVER